MASAALDDEELALSISASHTRRGSTRSEGQQDAPTATPAPREQRAAPHQKNARLGQYSIERTLGEGSFGKVKLATHVVTGQKVALKIISRRKVMARDMAGRIEREIQYLQLLRHPHIIKLYTVISTTAEIIMVLEYAGTELFNHIVDTGRMEENQARRFFQQIVCAVEYCHRHKIVHRDLKPENLLLDDQMNVKIADFGLSNIMTDGNFLKTSCGSPNYAAPEVISGKLYAGPEVDVWSCGVILYVLLVGRLPFDDEYIPALFKKIASGQYFVPPYLSKDVKDLIARMLTTSPVTRITVQEIRATPWFNVDLAPYLQPPVEEFLDTGIDPNKAIDPRALAPDKPPVEQEKIHNAVVGKLGKTMGYGKEDVQHALAIDEPNAIKDAYLIVRENQLMKENPSMMADPQLEQFLSSPTIHVTPSPIAKAARSGVASMTSKAESPVPKSPLTERPVQSPASTVGSFSESRTPTTTIGVLPTSVPDYHRAFMAGGPKSGAEELESNQGPERTEDQKAATARHLKPHNRSQTSDKTRPDGMTPLDGPPQKKPRPTKWQFGIRSRNAPSEAMLAIYKALKAMGADWEVPRMRKPGTHTRDASHDDSFSGSDASPSGSEDEDTTRGRPRRRAHYGSFNDWGYSVPQDPWIINARFSKHGIRSAKEHASDNNVNNLANKLARDAAKISGSPSSQASPSRSSPMSKARNAHLNDDKESAYIYMTIQLYSIEKEFYLVDFKCAGYEALTYKMTREERHIPHLEWINLSQEEQASWSKVPMPNDRPGDPHLYERHTPAFVGDGRAVEEKEVSSPFPFLNTASRLIIQLAEADG